MKAEAHMRSMTIHWEAMNKCLEREKKWNLRGIECKYSMLILFGEGEGAAQLFLEFSTNSLRVKRTDMRQLKKKINIVQDNKEHLDNILDHISTHYPYVRIICRYYQLYRYHLCFKKNMNERIHHLCFKNNMNERIRKNIRNKNDEYQKQKSWYDWNKNF